MKFSEIKKHNVVAILAKKSVTLSTKKLWYKPHILLRMKSKFSIILMFMLRGCYNDLHMMPD